MAKWVKGSWNIDVEQGCWMLDENMQGNIGMRKIWLKGWRNWKLGGKKIA